MKLRKLFYSCWLRFWVLWISIIILFFGQWGIAALDLVLNPWLKNIPFHWYMCFTTRHALTIWYTQSAGALIFMAIASLIFGSIFAYCFSRKD